MAKADMITKFMSSDINSPGLVSSLEALGFRPKVPGKWTFEEIMVCSQIASAVRGDARAYKTVMDFAGEKPSMPLEDFIQRNVIAGLVEETMANMASKPEEKKTVRKRTARKDETAGKGEK